MNDPAHLVVMGVSGSGKSTVAELLAARLRRPFAEADEFHPPENIDKMAAGEPLTDDDRWPWLRTMRDWLTAQSALHQPAIVTCSALRRVYRDVLREARGTVLFVHLSGDPALVGERIGDRSGHFMPASLLPSQYQTLEPLGTDERGVTVSVEGTPEEITTEVIDGLGLGAEPTSWPGGSQHGVD
nr:gluconokinase [Haloactinopolyspora alba]